MAKSNIKDNTHGLSQHQRLARGEAVTGQTLRSGGRVKDTDKDDMKGGGKVKLKAGGKVKGCC